MNLDLHGRLSNWKFDQALSYLAGEPKKVQKAVRKLAEQYGNVGWFDGSEADKIVEQLEKLGVND